MNAQQIIEQLKEAEALEKFIRAKPYWTEYRAPEGFVCVASLDLRGTMGTELDQHIYDIYRRPSDGLVYSVADDSAFPVDWADAKLHIAKLFPRDEWVPESDRNLWTY